MANKKMLIAAAEKFINKVETGRAYSRETYKELKEALESPEIDPLTTINPDEVKFD